MATPLEKLLELSSLTGTYTAWEHFSSIVGGQTINVFEPIEIEYVESEVPIVEYIQDPTIEIEYIEPEIEIIEFIEPEVIEVEIVPDEQLNIDYDA